MIDYIEIMENLILILFVFLVVTSISSSNTDIKEKNALSEEKMGIINLNKDIVKCLSSNEGYIEEATLDILSGEYKNTEDMCGRDFKDIYVKISAVDGSGKIWEFGEKKNDDLKASHTAGITILSKNAQQIKKRSDLSLEKMDYIVSFKKIELKMDKDPIKVSFRMPDTKEKMAVFNTNEKNQIADLYEKILNEGVYREFLFQPDDNKVYTVEDFMPESGFAFYEYGKSNLIGRGRPVWFEIDMGSSIRMGLLYVEA